MKYFLTILCSILFYQIPINTCFSSGQADEDGGMLRVSSSYFKNFDISGFEFDGVFGSSITNPGVPQSPNTTPAVAKKPTEEEALGAKPMQIEKEDEEEGDGEGLPPENDGGDYEEDDDSSSSSSRSEDSSSSVDRDASVREVLLSQAEKNSVKDHIYISGTTTLFHNINVNKTLAVLGAFRSSKGGFIQRKSKHFKSLEESWGEGSPSYYLSNYATWGWMKRPERGLYEITPKGKYALEVFEQINNGNTEKKEVPRLKLRLRAKGLDKGKEEKEKSPPNAPKRKRSEVEQDDYEEMEEENFSSSSSEEGEQATKQATIINPTDNKELSLIRGDRHFDILSTFSDSKDYIDLDTIFNRRSDKTLKRSNMWNGYVKKQLSYGWIIEKNDTYRITGKGLLVRQRLSKELGKEDTIGSMDLEEGEEIDEEIAESEKEQIEPQKKRAKGDEEGEVNLEETDEKVFFKVHPLTLQPFLIEHLDQNVLPQLEGSLEEILERLRVQAFLKFRELIANTFQSDLNVELGDDFTSLLEERLQLNLSIQKKGCK